jgi:hypothetical protein
VRKETPKPRDEAFICMFCGCVTHLDEFCFWRKRIERRCFDYARNSYRDEFFDFHFALSLTLWPTLILMFCLSSLMDLTITHMVLVHERTALSLNTLVMAHVLIVVIISFVGLFFLLEGLYDRTTLGRGSSQGST